MLTRILKAQRGFTLIELLAVIAILTVLSGIVAGAVTGIGASGQSARLVGDADTIGKAADRFFNDAFPQAYPVLGLADTPTDVQVAGDLGVRLVDFDAVLPGDPTRSFAPDFLKEIPDTAALVSWRAVTATGQVFFAQDGAQLVRPSNARLDVSAANSDVSTSDVSVQSDYTFKLRMNKNEAGLEVLGFSIPAGYSIGGQSATTGDGMGTFSGTLSTDNPWSPGQVLAITGTLKATGSSNEWEIFVNYPTEVNDHLTLARADRTHTVSITTPSEEAAGALKIALNTTGDKAHNQATETWTLTIFGTVGNSAPSASNRLITNPSVKGVYRWLATQHTSIDVTDLFSGVTGNQAVVIKDS
jgi:prepilin-type N-terminal cleavage/methylation domain-containing protein